MLNIYIRDRALEVLHKAYPELASKYQRFMITTEAKELKKHSKYSFSKKTITICTLSRAPMDIFISVLCELAKHIDIINREETHYDKEYFVVLKKLLVTATNSNIIKIESITKYSDQQLKRKLQSFCGGVDFWKFDIQVEPKFSYIFAIDSFALKNVLKTNDYMYDSAQALWYKRIAVNDFIEENAFTEKHSKQASFIIIGDNSFFIRPVYLLKLKTYAKNESSLLKALDFRYDGEKHCWTKIIAAKEIFQEISNIENVPRQSLIITKKLIIA